MKRLVVSLVALALLLIGAAGQACAGFVTNGSFEAVQIGSPFFSTNPADIPGWTHSGSVGDALLWGVGYFDSNGSATVAGDGNQFVTMGSGFDKVPATSGWSQILTGLTPGDNYLLTFKMAAEGTDSGPQSLMVGFPSGSSTAAQSFTAVNGDNYWRNWVNESMTFVASSSSVTLQFSAGLTPDLGQGEDVGLDAVSVVPAAAGVPEPSTLVLGTIGLLSFSGGAWWRRQRRHPNAVA